MTSLRKDMPSWGPYTGLAQNVARRHTAIVATLGPASQGPLQVRRMIREGMDVVRLSLNSGDRQWHTNITQVVREAATTEGRPVRLIADLQDRKNRLGALPEDAVEWHAAQSVELTRHMSDCSTHRTWLTHGWPANKVTKGQRILIDDGALELCVEGTDDSTLQCVVVRGGRLTAGRGVTMPGIDARPAGLTSKDLDDLRFVHELGVDMVALSFANSPESAQQIRDLAPGLSVIGKVEDGPGVERINELADAFDGLMVARGDLAVELPYADVPFVQKDIVRACAEHGVASMVATQLLHSMRESVLPTRAEVADIAQAVLDGTDYLVLSGETGYGKHPVQAIRTLRLVIERAEDYLAATDVPLEEAEAGRRIEPARRVRG